MAEFTARIDLPLFDGRAAAAARKAIRPVLESWNCTDEDWLFDAGLIVTELVANAIRHGGGGLELMLTLHEQSVTVSVADGSAVIPEVQEPDADDDGGRGLLIIEALSDAWGVEDHHGGKRVWVRLQEPSTDPISPRCGPEPGQLRGHGESAAPPLVYKSQGTATSDSPDRTSRARAARRSAQSRSPPAVPRGRCFTRLPGRGRSLRGEEG